MGAPTGGAGDRREWTGKRTRPRMVPATEEEERAPARAVAERRSGKGATRSGKAPEWGYCLTLGPSV